VAELNDACRRGDDDPERAAITGEPPAAAVAAVEALCKPFDAARLDAARAGLAVYLNEEKRTADRAALAALRKDAPAALATGDVQKIARIAWEVSQLEAGLAPPKPPPSLADLCRGLADRPTLARLATGIATMDDACRGGIPAGRRVVVVGAPGAGKTALAVQWGHDWSIAGARIVYLVADTDREPILVRLGQREGLCRDDLEGINGPEGKRAAWLTLADRVAALPLVVLDGADATVEEAIATLRAMPGDGPRVLFLDSLQRIRCLAADGADTPRARMDTILDVLRPLCAEGISVVALSEMGRGAYIAGERSTVATLAAAKESGAIEYFADLQIGLRNVAGEADLVDVDTPKNRLGTKPDLRLRLDFARANFAETKRPPKVDATPGGKGAGSDLERKILDACRAHSLGSASAIWGEIKGNRPAVLAKVKAMLQDGRLVPVGGRLRPGDGEAGTDAPADDDARGTSTSTSTSVGTSTSTNAPPVGGGTGTGTGSGADAAMAMEAIRTALASGPAPSLDAVRFRVGKPAPYALKGAWEDMRASGAVVNVGTSKAPAWQLAPAKEATAPP
jgi:hypothetical protein